MTIQQFCEAIETAEFDPRPGLIRRARAIIESSLRNRPSDYQQIADSLLAALAQQAIAIIESGGGDLNQLLAEFTIELRNAVAHEDEIRRAKPPSEVVANVAGRLERHGWRGFERHCLAELLEPAEMIGEIGIRSVTTNRGRTLTRTDLQTCRPVTHRRDDTWLAQFTSENELCDLEAKQQGRDLEA